MLNVNDPQSLFNGPINSFVDFFNNLFVVFVMSFCRSMTTSALFFILCSSIVKCVLPYSDSFLEKRQLHD